MGPIAASKALQVLRNTEYVVAIEFLCAAQAIELRGKQRLGAGTKAVHQLLRKHVSPVTEDRVLSGDIEAITELIRSDVFLGKCVER